MRAVVQRVRESSVVIDGKTVSEIGPGLLILLCVMTDDTEEDIEYLAKKCGQLRIFDDEKGIMNRNIAEAGGGLLVVSQFTLAASVKKGNRPSYIAAAGPDKAVPYYDAFCCLLSEKTGIEVKTGVFGADMKVSLTNDGPVTIIIDSHQP